MDGTLNDFWDRRPEIEPIERLLLNVFWRLRREVDSDSVIKSKSILEELESVPIESDIGLVIIRSLDDHYRMLHAEEMKRKRAAQK